jgi:hypothetical protein
VVCAHKSETSNEQELRELCARSIHIYRYQTTLHIHVSDVKDIVVD